MRKLFTIIVLIAVCNLFMYAHAYNPPPFNLPPPLSAGSNAETCTNSYTLNADAAVNGTGYWTVISGNGVFVY